MLAGSAVWCLAIFAALFWLTARRGATDPVCGMKVDRSKALRAVHAGRTFFFCSYEGFRQAVSTVTLTLVPTGAQRASVTEPNSQRLLQYWPGPNTSGAGNYISAPRTLDSDDQGDDRRNMRSRDGHETSPEIGWKIESRAAR